MYVYSVAVEYTTYKPCCQVNYEKILNLRPSRRKKAPRHHAEVPGGFSYKAGRCGSSPPWGGGYLVEQLVVCKTAHRQLCALTGVGEGKEGVVYAQRQHAVDVQGGLT